MSSIHYINLKSEKEKELRDYKKRRTQLSSIMGNCLNDFEWNASCINGKCSKVAETIENGIILSGGTNSAADMWNVTEQGASDSNISECHSWLAAEKLSVDTKISELEQKIASLKVSIQEEKEKERKAALEKILGG